MALVCWGCLLGTSICVEMLSFGRFPDECFFYLLHLKSSIVRAVLRAGANACIHLQCANTTKSLLPVG